MVDRVVVIGAAGFGRESLDVVCAMMSDGSAVSLLGVVDDHPSDANLLRLADRDVPYLGTLTDWLATLPQGVQYVLGVGDPAIRRRLVTRLDGRGVRPFTAVHPNATLGTKSTLAEGAIVCAGAVISTNVRIGRHVHINPNATIGHDALLHDFVSINPAATVSGEVIVAEGTLVGAGSTILQNLTVGAGVVVGAGAVVTKDVPPDVVVKGVPGSWMTTTA